MSAVTRTGLSLAVGVGGAAGAVARYLGEYVLARRLRHPPFAILVINVLGSAGLGAALAALPSGSGAATNSGQMLGWNVLNSGVIGAFTTFSTFTWDVWRLAPKGGRVVVWYLLGSVLGSWLTFGLAWWVVCSLRG